MLGLGGPVPPFDPAGGWDVVPVVIAVVALVLLRVLLRVRITPVVTVATVLAAPLFRAFADHAGFTRTVAVTLAFVAVIALTLRPGGRGGVPRLDV